MSFALSPAVDSTEARPRGTRRIATALLSAYDKSGVVDLARALARHGAVIVASGGTASALGEAGIPVLSVEEYTGLQSGFGGRVKTLHPRIHAGILARRDVAADLEELERAGARPIDLVYVNLYPFEDAVRRGAPEAERIETIDIGGPAMLRAAAKNWGGVAALCDPAQIAGVAAELDASGGSLTEATRRALAAAAFARTASYDAAIADDFAAAKTAKAAGSGVERVAGPASEAGAAAEMRFAPRMELRLEKRGDLRYGENPHQGAAVYTLRGGDVRGADAVEVIAGESLSYNNWVDLAAAAEVACALPPPAAVLVKHTNPCGAAVAPTLREAWDRALASDPVSAFGGIAAFNAAVDGATAEAMAALFLEIVVAPAFSPEALARFAKKPRLRVVRIDSAAFAAVRIEWKSLPGGVFLAQDAPGAPQGRAEWRTATKRAPSERELADLEFAWIVAAHVKSNAIVFARDGRTLGVGAGQMSRVDSVKIAVMKAREHGHDLEGSVVASDAFFPFADGPRAALAAGAVAFAQPGGSKRDDETLAACDEAGAAMVFTGRRAFRH